MQVPTRTLASVAIFAVWTAGTLSGSGAVTAGEPEPLHVQIDRMVESHSGGMVAPLASDAEFLRRLSLDLIGMPPSTGELREFLADSAPNKRALAVDRLLSSPHYARHMALTFDVMLMERRPAQQTSTDEWHAYLVQSFRDNKPFNQLAKEILTADGFDPATRAIARFYLDRDCEPNLITRDVGRMFFGRDLQCCQCHDHPLVDDYQQSDYQGLLAFFEPGLAVVLKKEGEKETKAYGERSGSDREFESVFVKGKKRLTGPKLPGEMEISEPKYYPGDEYEVKPGGTAKPVPKFSRRQKLAELATSGTNRAFNENIANRLWAHMMGRGLVQPVDWNHSGNPPSYPDVLKILGESFASMRFDVKAFLREMALTKTYQRSIDVPSDVVAQARQAVELVAHLNSQRPGLAKELEVAQAAHEKASEAWSSAEQTLLPAMVELNQARAKAEEAAKKVAEAQKAAGDVKASLEGKESVAKPLAEAAAKATEAAAKLKEDKELAEAVAKIAERAGKMQGEVEALRKAAEEKSAALSGTMGEMNTARQAMDAVVETKVAPVEKTERTAEEAAVEAKKRFVDAATRLIGLDKRIEKVQAFAHVADLDNAAAAAEQAVAASDAAIGSARSELASFEAVVGQHQAVIAAAEAEKAKAVEALGIVEGEHRKRQSLVDSMSGAVQTVQVALRSVPGDEGLTKASATFQAKAQQFASEVESHRPALEAASAVVAACEQRVSAARKEMESILAEQTRRSQAVSAAEVAKDKAVAQLQASREAVHQEIAKLAEDWVADFTMAAIKPLSAEQLCWSILRVSDVEDRYRAAEQAELDKTAPMPAEAAKDPSKLAARARDIEQRTYDKLKGTMAGFVQVFAAAGGQPQGDFFATADQALFVANGGAVNQWIAPSGGNVTERVIKESDAKKAADDLYLTILSRTPSESELTDVVKRLGVKAEEKAAVVQELVWGLVTSAEFRFNH